MMLWVYIESRFDRLGCLPRLLSASLANRFTSAAAVFLQVRLPALPTYSRSLPHPSTLCTFQLPGS